MTSRYIKFARQYEKTHEELRREEAERRVLAIYGPWDAPGFEACVQGELNLMRRRVCGNE